MKWNPSEGSKMSHRTDTAIGDVYCQSQYCVYSHYNTEKISHRNALSIGCRISRISLLYFMHVKFRWSGHRLQSFSFG
jgi:hypothetical protein